MNENNEKVVKTKTSKGVIALLVILILIVIGLSSYIVYDKFTSKDNVKEEIKNTKNEEKNESESNENESNSLKGKKFVLSTEGNKKNFYFNFISDTEYECLISDIDGKANNDYKYNSKGTYTYDGKNITLSDSKIDVILKNSMLYVNFDNYKFASETENCYDVYFDVNKINEEFKKIGDIAAKERIENWNSNHSIKINKTEGKVDSCYRYENDADNYMACSINVHQYFNDYDQYACINDSTSIYQESVISSGKCESDHSVYWSFRGVYRNENGYTISGSWTG